MSSAEIRQAVEREIVQAAITQVLAAGFLIEVNDGEEDVLEPSKDYDAIYNSMFTTDEDWLFVYRGDEEGYMGWVRFIYGNDGYDVLSNNTVNLEPYLTEATKLSNKYAG